MRTRVRLLDLLADEAARVVALLVEGGDAQLDKALAALPPDLFVLEVGLLPLAVNLNRYLQTGQDCFAIRSYI